MAPVAKEPGNHQKLMGKRMTRNQIKTAKIGKADITMSKISIQIPVII
jgi:hypothetical protein